MVLKRYKSKKGRKKKFSKQFKEHLRIGLSAATGFVIAFFWREPLIIFVNNSVLKYLNSNSLFFAGILGAFIVTILGVIFIYIITKFLK
jgi:hypothetical protein